MRRVCLLLVSIGIAVSAGPVKAASLVTLDQALSGN